MHHGLSAPWDAGPTFIAATLSSPAMPHLKPFASLLEAVTLMLAALATAPAAHALGSEQVILQVPFIAGDAVVTGEVGVELQTTTSAEGSGFRKLLQGCRPSISTFPRCPRCSLTPCTRSTNMVGARRCVGRCRRDNRIFNCSTRGLRLPVPTAPSTPPGPSRSRGRSSSRRSRTRAE